MGRSNDQRQPELEGGEALSSGEITPEQCAREVMETVPLVMRFIRTEMRAHGATSLSMPQFRALLFLQRQPGACLSDLADHLGVTLPTASIIVDRLVRRGLLDRADDPEQRRRVALTLTPSGREHLEAAREATRGRMAAVLHGMSRAQLRKIAEGAALLKDSVKEVMTPHVR